MLRRFDAWLRLGACLALLAGFLTSSVAWGQGGADIPVCCPEPASALEQAMGSLAVTVRLAGGGGPPPPAGLQPAAPQPIAASPGIPVEALPVAEAPEVVAEAVTDTRGQALLTVQPGRYWVVVPAQGPDGAPTIPGAIASELPNGMRVHASQEVTVAAGETAAVSLGIMVMLP